MYAVMFLLCVGSADAAVSQVPGSAELLEDLGGMVGTRGKPPVTTRVVITGPAGADKRQETAARPEVRPVSAFAARPRPEQNVAAFASPTPLPPPTLPAVPAPTASLPPPPAAPAVAAMTPATSTLTAPVLGGSPSQPAMRQAQKQLSFVEFIQGAMQSPVPAAAVQPDRPPMNGSGLRSLYRSLQ